MWILCKELINLSRISTSVRIKDAALPGSAKSRCRLWFYLISRVSLIWARGNIGYWGNWGRRHGGKYLVSGAALITIFINRMNHHLSQIKTGARLS